SAAGRPLVRVTRVRSGCAWRQRVQTGDNVTEHRGIKGLRALGVVTSILFLAGCEESEQPRREGVSIRRKGDRTLLRFVSGNTLKGARLENDQLGGADLARQDATGAKLHNTNLQEADLHETILSGADLSGATLTGANLRAAKLDHANLDTAELTHADLAGA